MKCMLLFTGHGCLAVLTSHASATDPALVAKLAEKGIEKYIAREVPIDLAEARYGGHFAVASHDLHETDDLRILDEEGERALRLFSFEELGPAIEYEAPALRAMREAIVRNA